MQWQLTEIWLNANTSTMKCVMDGNGNALIMICPMSDAVIAVKHKLRCIFWEPEWSAPRELQSSLWQQLILLNLYKHSQFAQRDVITNMFNKCAAIYYICLWVEIKRTPLKRFNIILWHRSVEKVSIKRCFHKTNCLHWNCVILQWMP